MKKIEKFMLPEHTNSLYENEAISSISLTREVADKINEIVDMINQLSQGDLEWKQTQEGTIRKGVLFMKDNLVNSLNELLQLLTENGFIESRIKGYTDLLSARLDNLLSSLTVDGEMFDARIGTDGTAYKTVGDAIREQFYSIIESIVKNDRATFKELGTVHTIAGYLNNKGGFLESPDFISKYIDKIPAVPGEKFFYNGVGRSGAMSWIFFNGSTIIETGQYEGETIVTAPPGTTHVMFSSMARSHEPLVFEVRTANENVWSYDLENQIKEQKTHISTLENGIYKYKATTYHSGYLNRSGGFAVSDDYHCLVTDKILVNPGDKFNYTGIGRSSAMSWIFFNGDTIVGTGQHNGTTVVTIPENVTSVIFSSMDDAVNSLVLQVYSANENLWCSELENRINDLATKAPSNDILRGKVWYACGDSFTYQGYSASDPENHKFTDEPYKGREMVYPFFIGRRTGINVINLARGGMTMAKKNDDDTNNFMQVYQSIGEDADYITIKLGINDLNYDSPIGDIDSTDITTFYGAYNTALTWIITNRPRAKVGIIVTNGTSDAIAEATKQIAKKYGIPTLNMYDGENVPVVIRSGRKDVDSAILTLRNKAFAVDYDGSRTGETNRHPNNYAQEYESTFVETWLRTL